MIGFAVRRWQITLVAFGLLAAIGVSAFLTIPRSVDPHFTGNTVLVIVTQPGADPTDMEQTVAKPIEDVVQGLDNLGHVASTSTDSTAIIAAQFDWQSDPDKHYDDVVREVNAIRQNLPASVTRIEFKKFRTTEAAVLQLALVSDTASFRRLEKIAKDLRERLNQVDGVRQTRVWGIPTPELRVAVDPGRLAQLGLPVSAITDALRAGGTDLPPGAVQSGDARFNVEAGGAFRSIAEVADAPVRAEGERVIRVRDVASVGWGYEERPYVTRFDGRRAVFVTLTQKDNLNVLDIERAALAAVNGFRAQLPPDVRLEVGFDQSHDIATKLAALLRDFGIALALVLLTLLPLGLRASLVVMVSVPLSLAIGCAVLAFSGFTLNQLSIAGFIIALGLLVDDSIVVTENIARRLREGEGRATAAIEGTRQIAVAVLGCTGVLLLAFLPLAFLPEGSGKFIRSLPIAVFGTVAGSLLVSLTIVPFLASRVLARDGDAHGNRALQAIQTAIHRVYAPALHWSLTHPWRALGAAMLLCVASFGLVPLIGSSLFPAAETPYFLVEVRAPEGAALVQTDRAVRAVEAALAREPAVRTVMANIGRSNPQIYYNQASNDQATNLGGVLAVMDRWDPAHSPAMIARLRAAFDRIADAQVTIKLFQNGPPVDAAIVAKLRGPDLGELKRLSLAIEQVMRHVPGTRDVSNPIAVDRPRLDLNVDADKAALLGIAPGTVRRTVRLALVGEAAGRFRDAEGDSYNVVVRLPLGETQPVSVLDRIYVPSTNGGAVPLTQIAAPRLGSAPPRIVRDYQQREIDVSADVQPGFLTAKVNAGVFAALAKLPLPPGYHFAVGGEAEQAQKSFGGLGPVIAVAVFGIVGVLVVEFGRFREVAVVAGVVPLGVFGGLVALFLSGNS
ncbi:MAG: efflux RND transporter permease subunit, partial [Sphingomonadaceae bacterium]|nr:efflux RND transporter permease subunit [Sphingomonadaceae bacterium]